MYDREALNLTLVLDHTFLGSRGLNWFVCARVTSSPLSQRSAGELDDDALRLTGNALVENPDVATFWNFRREVVTEKLSNL